MLPLNYVMNQVADMATSNSFFNRQIVSRAMTFTGAFPLEVLATLQNMIKLPFQSLLMCVKLPAKIVNLGLNSQTFKEFESGLPGPLDIIKTMLKIIGYAIGTLFTLTLGLISPVSNFRLHDALKLVKDEKAEAQRYQVQLEAKMMREAQEKAMQAHIQSLVLAMRLKIAEKERLIAEEALKRKEVDEKEQLKAEEERTQKELHTQKVEGPDEEVLRKQKIEQEVATRLEEELKRIKLSGANLSSKPKNTEAQQETSTIKEVKVQKPKGSFFTRFIPGFFKSQAKQPATQ